MKYQNIGKENVFRVLNLNGIMPPITMTALAAYQYMDTLKNHFSDLAISARPSLSSCTTSIVIFTLKGKYN